MKIKNISIVENKDFVCFNNTNNQLVSYFYKKYEVTYNNKTDIICYSSEWSKFEPYYGNFTDDELELIISKLFNDAKYNNNFSIF